MKSVRITLTAPIVALFIRIAAQFGLSTERRTAASFVQLFHELLLRVEQLAESMQEPGLKVWVREQVDNCTCRVFPVQDSAVQELAKRHVTEVYYESIIGAFPDLAVRSLVAPGEFEPVATVIQHRGVVVLFWRGRGRLLLDVLTTLERDYDVEPTDYADVLRLSRHCANAEEAQALFHRLSVVISPPVPPSEEEGEVLV